MNPDIYDDIIKEKKSISAEAQEPMDYTKEELIVLKEKIKRCIEELRTNMTFDNMVESDNYLEQLGIGTK